MFGVSPAWFLSLFGENFTIEQATGSLVRIHSLGFRGWQPEVFHMGHLREWETGKSDLLHTESDNLNLLPTQFFAHFLLNSFTNTANLESDWGIQECERLLVALKRWPEITVITIPLPAFEISSYIRPEEYRRLYSRLVYKLDLIAGLIVSYGKKCALEIMPGSLIAGSEGALRLRNRDDAANYKINLDTGHYFAAREPLELTLGRIGDYVSSTHLCDNDGVENLSLEPGAGGVNWNLFREWAQFSDYTGSWDIEIRCPEHEVEERYSRGLEFLKRLLEKEAV